MAVLKKNWLRVVTHIGALAPLAILIVKYASGDYLVAPARQIITSTGRTAIVLVILSLACTPVSFITGFKRFLRVRAALGLYAFGYLTLHLLVYVGWDYGFDMALLIRDLPYQRYVIVGMITYLLLTPLAVTSTRAWQHRMGKRWQHLHRLFYLAALLDIVHFLWLAKDPGRPLRYGALVVLLLLIRLKPIRQWVVRVRGRISRLFRNTDA